MITFFYLQKPDGPHYARMKHRILPNGSDVHCQLLDDTKLHLLPGSSYAESMVRNKVYETYITGEARLHSPENHCLLVYADELQIEVCGGEFHVMAYPECRHWAVEAISGQLKLNFPGGKTVLNPGDQFLFDKSLQLPIIRRRAENCPSLNCLPIDICIAILSRKFDCNIELAPELDLGMMLIFHRNALTLKQALEPVCEQLNLKMSMHEGRVSISK